MVGQVIPFMPAVVVHEAVFANVTLVDDIVSNKIGSDVKALEIADGERPIVVWALDDRPDAVFVSGYQANPFCGNGPT